MDYYKFRNKKILEYIGWIIILIIILFFCSRGIAEELNLDFPTVFYEWENDVRDFEGYTGLFNKDAAIIISYPADSSYNLDITIWAKQDSMPSESAILSIESAGDTTELKINSTVFKEFNTVIKNADLNQIKFRFANAGYISPGGALKDRNLYIDKIKMIYSTPVPEQSDSTRQITVSWDPNSENDLAGYYLYYGFASRDYLYRLGTKVENISLLTDRYKTYYFAVTAYDTANNESDYSVEVPLLAEEISEPEYYPGDINKDLIVDSKDFFIILAYLGEIAPEYDIDGDNKVTSVEFFNFLNDLGKTGYKVQ